MSFLSRLIVFIINVTVIWWLFKTFFGERSNHARNVDRDAPSAPPLPNSADTYKDPYKVLGLSPSASQTEIKEAYRQKLQEYHPDKVSHMGEDLQKLAQSKTIDIINAYNSLKKIRNDL